MQQLPYRSRFTRKLAPHVSLSSMKFFGYILSHPALKVKRKAVPARNFYTRGLGLGSGMGTGRMGNGLSGPCTGGIGCGFSGFLIRLPFLKPPCFGSSFCPSEGLSPSCGVSGASPFDSSCSSGASSNVSPSVSSGSSVTVFSCVPRMGTVSFPHAAAAINRHKGANMSAQSWIFFIPAVWGKGTFLCVFRLCFEIVCKGWKNFRQLLAKFSAI